MEQKSMGKRVKRLRESRAWTQEHLADAAQISVRTVQRAEDGVMSAETLKAIAGALDESVEAISKSDSGYPRITPVVYYEDPKSVDWLVKTFGFGLRMKVPGPDGTILHAELTFEDALIMVGPPMDREQWTTPRRLGGPLTQSVYVIVDDVDAHYTRVSEADAKILSLPQDAHGQRRYSVEDPEGHLWWFVQPLS